MKIFLYIPVLFCNLSLNAQVSFIDNLATDTLFLEYIDNASLDFNSNFGNYNIQIKDDNNSNNLGVTQINKYFFIPVDQHIVIDNSIQKCLKHQLRKDSVKFDNLLVVDNLTLWYDSKSFLNKSYVINGHSYIEKENTPVKEWYWEVRRKKKWHESKKDNLSLLFAKWLAVQSDSLANLKINNNISPIKLIRYRRVLKSWSDFILLQDGYIINANLTLDFPKDHFKGSVFGSGGLYYRKSSYMQSFGISTWDQHWLIRFNRLINIRMNANFRVGLNKLNCEKFKNPEVQNLLMVNCGLSAAIQYQPVNNRGIFLGLGPYLNINGLPDIPDKIKTLEPGFLFIIGLRLP